MRWQGCTSRSGFTKAPVPHLLSSTTLLRTTRHCSPDRSHSMGRGRALAFPGMSPTRPSSHSQEPTSSHLIYSTHQPISSLQFMDNSCQLHPYPSQRCHYPHRELPAAFWDLTRLGSARLSSGLQASVFASSPAQTPSPKSETGSFSVDSQMATAFNMDYMGFATITASVGIGSSGRSGQPKQQNLSWLHMRVDIWLPLTLSTGQ